MLDFLGSEMPAPEEKVFGQVLQTMVRGGRGGLFFGGTFFDSIRFDRRNKPISFHRNVSAVEKKWAGKQMNGGVENSNLRISIASFGSLALMSVRYHFFNHV